MLTQFQEGSCEDLWNYSSEDLWRSDSILRLDPTEEIDERTPLIYKIILPTSSRVSQWTESFVKRACILNILPVIIVLIWCSMPIPFDDCPTLPCDYQGNIPIHMNFWFYLFWYFGIYNAIALFLITKLFSIYAFNWYTKQLGAQFTFILFWIVSQAIGITFYYFSPLRNLSLIWIGLTFFTMSMPLITAFSIIRRKRKHQKIRHRIATESANQKMQYARYLPNHPLKRKKPASYRRFLWFCTALSIALLALVGGEMYAYLFLSTMPHTPMDAFVYVYSWVSAIYVMDAMTDWIIYRKIRSHPLASIFRLYFFMIYFIFYRNLFARLRSVDQFAIVQLGSFLWVCIYYPIVMTQTVYHLLVRILGVTLTYGEYKQKIARSFYLRNLAENTSMLGFLYWVNILHFGPNRAAYPYFYMDDKDGNPYNHLRTFIAALVIWTSELTSSLITRWTFKRLFHHSVTQQAIEEFKRYPEMIIGFILVMVHVLQNILFALIKLEFMDHQIITS